MDSQKAPPAPTASSWTPAVKPQAPVSIPAAEQRLNDNAVDMYTTARMQQTQRDIDSERKAESERSFKATQDRVAAKPQVLPTSTGPRVPSNAKPPALNQLDINNDREVTQDRVAANAATSPITAYGQQNMGRPIAPGAVPGTPSLASTNRAAAVATVGMPTAVATVGMPTAPATPPRESVNGRTYDALTDLQLQNIVRNTKTTKFGGELLDDSKQKQTFIQARDELARRAKK